MSNSSNNNKKRAVATIAAVVIAVCAVFGGGTFAYLQAETEDVTNNFMTSSLELLRTRILLLLLTTQLILTFTLQSLTKLTAMLHTKLLTVGQNLVATTATFTTVKLLVTLTLNHSQFSRMTK
jgi:predicted ribosomally synthesized peptide with SipW-like signal peptide